MMVATNRLKEMVEVSIPHFRQRMREKDEASYGSKPCPECGDETGTFSARCYHCGARVR